MAKKKQETKKISLAKLRAPGRKILLVAGLAVLGLAFWVLIYNALYSQRIFPRTFVAGIALGGKTQEEAKILLGNPLKSAAGLSVNLTFEDKNWTIKTDEIELRYNLTQSAVSAWNVGRRGRFGQIVKEQWRSLTAGNRQGAAFSYNEDKLNTIILDLAKQVDVPEQDATLKIDGQKTEVVAEKIGRRTNFGRVKESVLAAFGNLIPNQNLALAVEEVKPKITAQNARSAQALAEKILQSSLTLKSGQKDFNLAAADFASWLEFSGIFAKKKILGESTDSSIGLNLNPQDLVETWILQTQINQNKVKEYVAALAAEINREAKDAKFEVRSGRAMAFQLSQTGYELDQEKAVQLITTALLDAKTEVVLPIKVIKPQVTDNSAEDMGIREVVGEATTNFSGSPENRRHNIAVGAKAFHGIMIKPGEEFSTLKYLGPVEAATGYLPELVIKEDRTVPEYGGGLCQVSTTLFRTALEAGLKITERQNHSYRVRYYEPPVGMDATIYLPKPDLKFVNDLPGYILIQSYVSGDEITFKFYGSRDGRRTENTVPYVYDVIGAGEPIYTESSDLAAGEIKQVEKPHPGSKATFTYRVYDKANQLINEQKFDSSYVPWPARFLYGPGTTIPPAEE